MNLGVKIGIGVLAAAGVGTGIYFAFIRKAKPATTLPPITPTTPVYEMPVKKQTTAGKLFDKLLDAGTTIANSQLKKGADGVRMSADGATWM